MKLIIKGSEVQVEEEFGFIFVQYEEVETRHWVCYVVIIFTDIWIAMSHNFSGNGHFCISF